MMKQTAIGIAAAAAIGLTALMGGSGDAQAGVDIHIGVPGFYVGPPAPVYYGGYWAPSFYYGAAVHPRFYEHPRAPYHCHKWRRNGHHKKCHRHY